MLLAASPFHNPLYFYILPRMRKTEAYGELEAAARERILILDGSMGVLVQGYGLGEEAYRAGPFASHGRELKGDTDALCLSSPEVILGVHRAYLEAGADIIKTNSFTSTRISQAEYGLEDYAAEMARESARLARRAVDEFSARSPGKRRFVAGSIGPTNKSLSLSPDASDPLKRSISFEELSGAYLEEARALIEGGADILLVETVFDTLNAKAAIYAILSLFEELGARWPIMLSGTIVDKAGRNLSGQTTQAFLASVSHADPFALGFNCSLGSEALLSRAEEIASISPFRLSVHPNAGLPNAEGGYDEGPLAFASSFSRFASEVGVNIAGGCCGTRPEHIAALSAALEGILPRKLPARRRLTSLSGLEALDIGPGSLFVNVGERANVSGSKKFARLVRAAARGESGYEEAIRVALEQVESGAQVVDFNLDDPLIDSAAAMRDFLNYAACEPDLSRVPFMLDSSDYPTLVAALRTVQGKCVVNSISLKEGEAAFLEKAGEIAKYGAAVVVMAFDEEGQADSLERRVSILERAHRLLVEKAGYSSEDIVLDPNIFAVGTGIEEHRRYALDFFAATRALKRLLPGCLISGGVSNVSFSFRGDDALREAIHTVFLYYAKEAGMDMGIVNPASLGIYDEIEEDLRTRIEDLLLDRRSDATERLLELASSARSSGSDEAQAAEPEWRRLSCSERLVHGLVNGVADWIAADAEEARLSLGGAYKVISGPLMEGMNKVGELFGAGKMFLPQVVKSARVMKTAVAAIEGYIGEGESRAARAKIVLATVKGDVHDIGKNIVSIVLQCNGYEVIDLGVMVPCDDILEAAEREGAAAVGLSGLITPSLEEMARVAREMEKRKLSMPLVVGGAATSPVHTALKIATAYSGPVANVRDASMASGVFSRLLDPALRPAYEVELRTEQERLRETRREKDEAAKLLSLEEARRKRFVADFSNNQPPRPGVEGVVELRPSVAELIPYIDWRFFFHEWGIKTQGALDAEALRLKAEGQVMLSRMGAELRVSPAALCALLPAASEGDDILIFDGESRSSVAARLPFLRQQRVKSDGSPQLCLADYVAAKGSVPDYLGIFAATIRGAEEPLAKLEASGDELGAIMFKILLDRLAEALAERLHEEVRRRIWAYAPDEGLSPEELVAGGYRGIRPAPGYPSCPDHRDKAAILGLLSAEERIGMSLTESYMMMPAASVSGFMFSHPDSRYFAVGRIGTDQVADYAARRGESPEAAAAAVMEALG
jgi:5-methyltetrahydrofolate--homocysteine methyltransferase